MTIALFGGTDLVIVEGAEVDGRLGEFHTFSAQATTYATESGALVSDHVAEQPDQLSVSWIVSNLDAQGSSYGTRAANVLDALRTRLKARKRWQVVTRHRLYPSMVIVGVTAENVGPFTGALRGRITFQEVPEVALERVTLPASRVGRKGAASKVEAGRQQPQPIESPSLLRQLTGG